MASFLVGLAFGVMVVCELVRGVGVDASVKASVFWPFLFVTVITIGEMCFSPLRNAFVSKYAPKKYLSLLMGVYRNFYIWRKQVKPVCTGIY